MTEGAASPRDGSREAERAKPARLPVRIWLRSVALGREVIAAAGGLLAALSVVFVGAVFVESLAGRSIDVEPLSVPKSLSDDGLSPAVAALRLRDRMGALAERVERERGYTDGTEIVDPEELPDVTVPSVGLSAQALAADVRAFFKIQNRLVVSGEIVSRDGAFDLTLRLNGRAIFHSPERLPRAALDALFAQGARAAVRATQPYIGAVVAFDEGDDASALAICDGIVERGGAASEVRHARLLQGQALSVAGRREDAATAFEALIALDPRDLAAHNGLGNVLAGLGQRDAAVAEYRKAIAIDGTVPLPHNNLARLYLAMGRPEDAVREARAATALGPKMPYPHFVLAEVLRGAGQPTEALREYRTAAALDPDLVSVRVKIGEALRGYGLRGEAVAQFKAALAIDPGSEAARRGLAAAPEAAAPAGEVPPAGNPSAAPEQGQDQGRPGDTRPGG